MDAPLVGLMGNRTPVQVRPKYLCPNMGPQTSSLSSATNDIDVIAEMVGLIIGYQHTNRTAGNAFSLIVGPSHCQAKAKRCVQTSQAVHINVAARTSILVEAAEFFISCSTSSPSSNGTAVHVDALFHIAIRHSRCKCRDVFLKETFDASVGRRHLFSTTGP